MHTPEQANKLWCPMSRLPHITGHGIGDGALTGVTYNRTGKTANCRANVCAMWRWWGPPLYVVRVVCNDPLAKIEPDRPAGMNPGMEFVPADEDRDACWVESEALVNSRRRGYCGLAGRPEVME
jgi:hypothetical protein